MNKYETMFIVRPDLTEEKKKALLTQVSDTIVKNNGTVTQASVWSERRKLFFVIKKCHEGVYFLVNFTAEPKAITEINHAYKLNESILRVLITKLDK